MAFRKLNFFKKNLAISTRFPIHAQFGIRHALQEGVTCVRFKLSPSSVPHYEGNQTGDTTTQNQILGLCSSGQNHIACATP